MMDSLTDVRDPAKGIDNGGTVETSSEGPLLKLEDLNYVHSFVRELPRDLRTDIMPLEVLNACYTTISSSAEVENHELVAWSDSVAKLLDLDTKERHHFPSTAITDIAAPVAGEPPRLIPPPTSSSSIIQPSLSKTRLRVEIFRSVEAVSRADLVRRG